MNEFETVFLFTKIASFHNRIIFGAIILQLILFFVIFILFVYLINNAIKKSSIFEAKITFGDYNIPAISYIAILPIVITCFYLFLLVVLKPLGTADYILKKNEYVSLETIYNSQKYHLAEGIVQVLHVQPLTGHENGDIIKIGNTELEINAYVNSFGYTQTISRGGVLTEGTYARIFYTEDPSFILQYTILRVDVKK